MRLHRAARVDEVPARGGLVVAVGGLEVGIFRVGARLVAWRNVCPHFGAPVCRGNVAGTTLPSRVYDLLTGRHLVESSRARLRQYPVEIHGEHGYIATR